MEDDEEEGEYEEEEEQEQAPEDIWDDSALINAYNEAVREYLVSNYPPPPPLVLWNQHLYPIWKSNIYLY